MRERLKPYIRTAKQYLRSESANPASDWPQKIVVHTKGLALNPSNIAEHVIDAIYSSVLSGNCLKITYDSLTSGEQKTFTFHPYGIVVRGERSYLIGKYDGYSDIRQLAISRVLEAEKLNNVADIDPVFSLKEFVSKGEMGVIRDDEKLDIKLWITPCTCNNSKGDATIS
jgi:predicted DNA-binding transcriptional regulator YafY